MVYWFVFGFGIRQRAPIGDVDYFQWLFAELEKFIDEALSVGDKAFTEKSLAKMHEFKAQGKTMFSASHPISQMKQFCDKVLWLEYGVLKEYGHADAVLKEYDAFLKITRR